MWITQTPDVWFPLKLEFKTNLMIACEMKNEEIVEILVNDKNINFTLEDFRNKTALFYAIANKHKMTGEKFVRILLKKYPAYVPLL